MDPEPASTADQALELYNGCQEMTLESAIELTKGGVS